MVLDQDPHSSLGVEQRETPLVRMALSGDGALEPMIQQHPDYHAGFYDAQDGAPLFDDAPEAYAAGWRAYWEIRNILNETKLTRP
jgi:hypothetical protein